MDSLTSLRMSIPSTLPTDSPDLLFNFTCSTIAGPPKDPHQLHACPNPRSGHRIVIDDSNLYSFGGYNPDHNISQYGLFPEVWQFNLATKTWTKLSNTGPTEAASHTMLLFRDSFLVFGGTGYPWGHGLSNTLHRFHLSTSEWQALQCIGEPPTPRYGHSMTFKDGVIYITGGTTGTEYNMNIASLCLKTLQWEIVTPVGEFGVIEDVPAPRYRHEVAEFGENLLILGGVASDVTFDFVEIPVFNTVRKTWGTMESKECPKCHQYPHPRKFYASVKFKKSVYICGGVAGENILDDIWRLDLKMLKWEKLVQCLPEPVYFHAAAVTPAGCLYVFGGVTRNVTETRTNKVFKMWLTVPTLQDVVWDVVTTEFPSFVAPKQRNCALLKLRDSGFVIPPKYVKRLC